MPTLDTNLHLTMLAGGRKRRGLLARARKAIRVLMDSDPYGMEWGDPDVSPPLRYVRDHFLRSHISPETTVLEIGPGGGRWTRYLLEAKLVYAVDYHEELLEELRKTVRSGNVRFIRNNGTDFPGVPAASVDFVFSFGTFVHLDIDLIEAYLRNLRPVLKQDANVVLHYSDKTKPLAQANAGFSENDPDRMRRLVQAGGYRILEEDTKTLWHSSLVRFQP